MYQTYNKEAGALKVFRILALAAGLFLMAVGIKFNQLGFNFVVPDMAWVGLGMPFIVTAIELVGSKKGLADNLTFRSIWSVAYVYGIATNIIGLLAGRGASGENLMELVFVVLFAVLLEVAPEPLLVWAVMGDTNMADPLKSAYEWISAFLVGNPQANHLAAPRKPEFQSQAQHRSVQQGQSQHPKNSNQGGQQPLRKPVPQPFVAGQDPNVPPAYKVVNGPNGNNHGSNNNSGGRQY